MIHHCAHNSNPTNSGATLIENLILSDEPNKNNKTNTLLEQVAGTMSNSEWTNKVIYGFKGLPSRNHHGF